MSSSRETSSTQDWKFAHQSLREKLLIKKRTDNVIILFINTLADSGELLSCINKTITLTGNYKLNTIALYY